jgi:uncharacterized protein
MNVGFVLFSEKQQRTRIVATTFFLFFLFTVAFPGILTALEVPTLRGRVNDYANLMPGRVQSMEQRLAQFENDTGHQITVLTIPTLGGEDIEGFSIRVAESWKIGKKGSDNGAILVIAQNDRKLRIEVGYGLEGVLPDAIASRIINEVIVPRFRDGDFPGGIEAGVDAIMKVTKGEPLPEAQRRKPPSGSSRFPFALLFPFLLFGFWIVSQLTSQRRGLWSTRSGSGGFFGGGFGGGGFGGGGGGFSGGGGGFGGGGSSGSW